MILVYVAVKKNLLPSEVGEVLGGPSSGAVLAMVEGEQARPSEEKERGVFPLLLPEDPAVFSALFRVSMVQAERALAGLRASSLPLPTPAEAVRLLEAAQATGETWFVEEVASALLSVDSSKIRLLQLRLLWGNL